ncbi:hypothetical protein JXA48_01550 [Candidatus Woesearchaeota archaeon]|nr:hypothetical protein [Candidatus Woesearchaeota archaeon]
MKKHSKGYAKKTQKNENSNVFLSPSKGQIAISFNWIFVIIVGAVFLTFFFSIISSQTKSSDQKVSATIAKQFETILGTTSQQPGTFKTYRTSPIELNFFCDANRAISYYAIKDYPAGYTTYDVMFTPQKMQGTSMFTWTQEWNYPFSVTNFLYVTNKFQMFIVYDPGDFGSSKVSTLLEDFPSNLTVYRMNETKFPSSIVNDDVYTYVFFDSQLDDIDSVFGPENIITEKAQIVIIEPDLISNIFKSGTVYFLTGEEYDDYLRLKNNLASFDSSPYFGKASLYGAMFSGEKQNYDCNMDKAFKRLDMMNTINMYRVENAIPDISPVTNCFFLYNGSSVVQDGLKQILGNISEELENGFLGLDKDRFIHSVELLEDKNSRVSFESRCPGLY